MDQLGRRKPARQFGGGDRAQRQLGAVEHERIGDFAPRPVDADAHRIIAHEVFELLGKIGAKQGRPRDRGCVRSGLIQPREGPCRGRRRRFWIIVDAQFGIGEQAGETLGQFGLGAVLGIAPERGTKIGHRRFVDRFELVEQRSNLSAGGERNRHRANAWPARGARTSPVPLSHRGIRYHLQ